MTVSSQNLRFIMGFKLKQFRLEKELSLKELAEKTQLSVSYLSEIEKGKKYPKPEKILQLAQALGVSFDELVSLQVKKELDPLPIIFSSPVLREFPFRMYGISPQDLLSLITGDPARSGALIRTFLEIGQTYDMRVEHLLFAALRSYQQMHQNYFEEIEDAVEAFVARNGCQATPPVSAMELQRCLEENYGYSIDEEQLSSHPELRAFRSVLAGSNPPRLLIQKDLIPSQKAYLFAREIGYHFLNLTERGRSPSWMKIESFEQLLNSFKASYFGGALLMPRKRFTEAIGNFLSLQRWDGDAFIGLIAEFGVTPEMLLYRISAILPRFFGIRDIIFFRFSHPQESSDFQLDKMFNMSQVFIPHDIGGKEHHCQRWTAIKLLKQLSENHADYSASRPLLGVQRLNFLDLKTEMFSVTFAHPSLTRPGVDISGTLCFVINDPFKKGVRFWNDPEVASVEVNETCERCGLSPQDCRERIAPPVIFNKQEEQVQRERILDQLVQQVEQQK